MAGGESFAAVRPVTAEHKPRRTPKSGRPRGFRAAFTGPGPSRFFHSRPIEQVRLIERTGVIERTRLMERTGKVAPPRR